MFQMHDYSQVIHPIVVVLVHSNPGNEFRLYKSVCGIDNRLNNVNIPP